MHPNHILVLNMRRASIGAALMLAALVPVYGAAPPMHVGYQPMVATGLAARHAFEAWFWLDKTRDPQVPGYVVPAGATMRVTFPKAFVPKPGGPLGGALLKGWVQGPTGTKFTLSVDRHDPRTIVVHFEQPIAADPPQQPGLKAIHLRVPEINPARAGDYPIAVRFENAGALTGITKAIAHITRAPLPNIAAYNQLSGGHDEEWQRVKAGAEAPLPIDFLVTLPSEIRTSIDLKPMSDGSLDIVSDGKPIGAITSEGVPVTLKPETFGPGFARLGIIRVHAIAGETPGATQIVAALKGGTRFTVHLIVER
ncbi:MAG TPA: hypothetical protein VNE59_07995 [Burkholderiales bacterium]|nr:hypothetical protein [Burkholderiales bacterium]